MQESVTIPQSCDTDDREAVEQRKNAYSIGCRAGGL